MIILLLLLKTHVNVLYMRINSSYIVLCICTQCLTIYATEKAKERKECANA